MIAMLEACMFLGTIVLMLQLPDGSPDARRDPDDGAGDDGRVIPFRPRDGHRRRRPRRRSASAAVTFRAD